jgi:ribonuclease BN (tRNA processing enzyme)
MASIQIPLPTTDSNRTETTNTHRTVKPPKTWTYRGYSRAGSATSFELVEPKWIFDCGCLLSNASVLRPTCIFITHTHADHIQTLHQILFSQKPIVPSTETNSHTASSNTTTAINGNTIHVYFPAASESHIRNFLQSYYELIRDDTTPVTNTSTTTNTAGESIQDMQNASLTGITMEQAYNFRLHPVSANEEFTVTAASNVSSNDVEYIVRIVQCCHRKVCIGYSIFQRQRIWMEPYRSMTGKELGNYIKTHSKKNTSSTSTDNSTNSMISNMKEWSPVRLPILCFLGDTTTQVFIWHPELLQQHTMIAMECTYYYGTIHEERTNVHQHTYWDVLCTNILKQHPNVLFLLQHFSNRHRRHEWLQWIYEYNQNSGHYNVHPMLVPSSSSPPTDAPPIRTTFASNATADLKDIVPIHGLALHRESSLDKISSTPAESSCNCFLCQPTAHVSRTTNCVP